MTITSEFKAAITGAEARALATFGPMGVNVVPISVVDFIDEKICLYNFFMKKTVQNIMTEPQVAFTVWSGLSGIQIKAIAEYKTNGEYYEAEVIKMKTRFPDRTLAGIIMLEPISVYDVSAGVTAGQQLV